MNDKLNVKKLSIIGGSVLLAVLIIGAIAFSLSYLKKPGISQNSQISINNSSDLASQSESSTSTETQSRTSISGQTSLPDSQASKGTIVLKESPPPSGDIKRGYTYTIGDNNLFFPKFDTRLDLLVASGSDKPSLTPRFSAIITKVAPVIRLSAPKSIFTKSNYVFIDKNVNSLRWFAFQLKNATDAKNVIWQVSDLPFSGDVKNWKTPSGLISSGQIAAGVNQFSIDFNNLSKIRLQSFTTKKLQPITQLQKTYYVRAFPVNAKGVPIGSPGTGMSVLYGQSLPVPFSNAKSSLQLFTPIGLLGNYTSEFSDLPRHDPLDNGNIVSFPANQPNSSRMFYFNNVSANSESIVIQVSTSAFNENNIYPGTKNLIYEKSYKLPVSYVGLPSSSYLPSVLVPFGQFGKKASEMQADQFVNYYVRGVVISPSIQQGRYDTKYTDTITVKYGFTKPVNIINTSPYDKHQMLKSSLPRITMKNYTPVKWSDPEYLSHYYVFKAPKAYEVTCNWKNVKTGEILMPYNSITKEIYKQQGIKSEADYEKIVVPRVLPVGAKVYIPPPKDEDKEWYEELFDGVVGFFKDLVDTFSKIYTFVQSTYQNLKTNLVSFVANLCPIPELKGVFEKALTALVDYGLMSMGIPPNLPSFSELSSMSVDYLTEVALTEAGIPAGAITDEVTQKVADGITKQLETMKNNADVNPLSSAFLKIDPDYSYRPAYIDLEMENKTMYPTVPGSVDINVIFKLDYYGIFGHVGDPSSALFLTSDNKYSYGSVAGIQTSLEYFNHFVHGLNGNTVDYKNGGEAIYQVFNPVVNTKIPIIPPNTKQTVRIYLSPATNSISMRYPSADNQQNDDFYNVYFNNGNQKHTEFILSGNFPSAVSHLQSEATKAGQFFIPDAKTQYYFYNEFASSSTSSEKVQKPVLQDWSK